MNLFPNFESPFSPQISFEAVIKDWESRLIHNPDDGRARDLLDRVKKIPELTDGFTGTGVVEKNKELISELLSPIFPEMLSASQISAVTFP